MLSPAEQHRVWSGPSTKFKLRGAENTRFSSPSLAAATSPGAEGLGHRELHSILTEEHSQAPVPEGGGQKHSHGNTG